jgi:hypothetical protein
MTQYVLDTIIRKQTQITNSASMLYISGFELTTLVVIGTDCIGSCKSNYHKITKMTAPFSILDTFCLKYLFQ